MPFLLSLLNLICIDHSIIRQCKVSESIGQLIGISAHLWGSGWGLDACWRRSLGVSPLHYVSNQKLNTHCWMFPKGSWNSSFHDDYCASLQDVCRFSEEAQDHEDLGYQRSWLVSSLSLSLSLSLSVLQLRHSKTFERNLVRWIALCISCWAESGCLRHAGDWIIGFIALYLSNIYTFLILRSLMPNFPKNVMQVRGSKGLTELQLAQEAELENHQRCWWLVLESYTSGEAWTVFDITYGQSVSLAQFVRLLVSSSGNSRRAVKRATPRCSIVFSPCPFPCLRASSPSLVSTVFSCEAWSPKVSFFTLVPLWQKYLLCCFICVHIWILQRCCVSAVQNANHCLRPTTGVDKLWCESAICAPLESSICCCLLAVPERASEPTQWTDESDHTSEQQAESYVASAMPQNTPTAWSEARTRNSYKTAPSLHKA